MRLFALLNFQHLMAVFFTTWLFMVVFGVGLAFSHLRGERDEARKKTIIGRHADG